MAHPLDLSGLWVPVITPFDADGAVDEPSLRMIGERILRDDAAGLVALGTTGEPSTLTADERRRVVSVCAEIASEIDKPLMVGVGSNSTADTLVQAQALDAFGPAVVAALVVVPYYTRPTEQAVVEHFEIVADASPVPVVMYNVPHRTGRGLGAASLLAAGAHSNIVGLKQAVGTLDHDTLDLLGRSDRGFEVLAGDDACIAPTVLMGGCGAIAAAGHVATPAFVALVDAARRGDLQRTRRLAAALLPVIAAGVREPSPSVWKGALHRVGEIGSPFVRRPMTSAARAPIDALVEAIADAMRVVR